MANVRRRKGNNYVGSKDSDTPVMVGSQPTQRQAAQQRARNERAPLTQKELQAQRKEQAKREEELRRRLGTQTLHLRANSVNSVETDIELPANALIHDYQVKVIATRGELAKANNIADLRATVHEAGSDAIVIDFGAMVTVDALLLPSTHQTHKLYPWIGAGFAESPHGAAADGSLGSVSGSEQRQDANDEQYNIYRFRFSEIRTEKLLLVPGAGDINEFMEQMELSLPQLPADLSLRVNGGAPVWTTTGPVALGSSSELSTDGFTTAGERLVDITEALAELVGDPRRTDTVTARLTMTSSVPGRLAILNASNHIQRLHRLSFNGEERLNIEFANEGQALLGLPANDANGIALDAVTGLRLQLQTDQAPERVLPATGPASSSKAELVLGKGRAACVRLDGGSGLELITAVRLPLRAGGNKVAADNSGVAVSAEAKVILWSSQNDAPLEPLEGGISAPVSFEGAEEQWLSFEFEEPLPFDPAVPLWAAVVVNRGEAAWRLAEETVANTPRLVRIGAPDGPWRALPSGFGVGQSLGQASARARVVGLAPETQPVAPLQLQFEGGLALQLDPGTEPLAVAITVPADALASAQAAGDDLAGAALSEDQMLATDGQDAATLLAGAFVTLTSHARGVVTLSDVDAITEFSNVAS